MPAPKSRVEHTPHRVVGFMAVLEEPGDVAILERMPDCLLVNADYAAETAGVPLDQFLKLVGIGLGPRGLMPLGERGAHWPLGEVRRWGFTLNEKLLRKVGLK